MERHPGTDYDADATRPPLDEHGYAAMQETSPAPAYVSGGAARRVSWFEGLIVFTSSRPAELGHPRPHLAYESVASASI
jgi:hypothetical protein